jgi:hypothetical protein
MIRQLVEGKALAHNVQANDLHSMEEILSILFATSDFVAEEKRSAMLGAIIALSTTPDRRAAKEADTTEAETTEAARRRTEMALVLMAIVASLLGGLTSILPRLGHLPGQFFSFAGKQDLYAGLVVTVASLGLLSLSLWFLRLRDSREDSVRSTEVRSRGSIERDVLKLLQEFQIPASIAGPESAYDFDAEINGKKTLIEVKSWSRRISLSLIRTTIRRMKSLVESGKGEQSLLITKEPVAFPELATIDPKVRLMTLKQLRNFLAHGSSSA